MAQPEQLKQAAASPVETDEPGRVEQGVALCLSGGGYRAMIFHVGAIWRLNELGYLAKLDRVSSVSGGSITAGVLGLNWHRLQFDANGVATNLDEEFVKPLRKLASKTIDLGAVIRGILLPGSISDRIAGSYRKHVFGEATLQDLPDRPRFVINSTNLQTGALWRFSKPYMADYTVGMVRNPQVELAVAVAASSAFPPILSPVDLSVDPESYDPAENGPLHTAPYTTDVVLSRRRCLRQPRARDSLEALHDDPRQRRRRQDGAAAEAEARLGAPGLPRARRDRHAGAQPAQAAGGLGLPERRPGGRLLGSP